MVADNPRLFSVARGWPVQVALGLVVAAVACMVGVDLMIARRVADRTAQIIGDTQRSVELLEDLHAETFRLMRGHLSVPALAQVKDRLTGLAQEYEPVASGA